MDLKCYKVLKRTKDVNGQERYYSCRCGGPLMVRYSTKKLTKPKAGLLMTFASLSDALAFVRWGEVIFECTGYSVKRLARVLRFPAESTLEDVKAFFAAKHRKKLWNNMLAPIGTLGCEMVMLEKKVYALREKLEGR